MSEDYRLQYLQMDAAPQLSSLEKLPYNVELKEHLWDGNKNIILSSKLHDVMQELYLLIMQTIAPLTWQMNRVLLYFLVMLFTSIAFLKYKLCELMFCLFISQQYYDIVHV